MTTVTQMPCFTQTEVGSFGPVIHYHLEPIFPARKKKVSVSTAAPPKQLLFPQNTTKGFFFLFLLAEPQDEGKCVVAPKAIL